MNNRLLKILILLTLLPITAAQAESSNIEEDIASLKRANKNLKHKLDQLSKSVDDVAWYNKVGSVASVDKVVLTGPPRWRDKNTTGLSYGNPLKFSAYVFIPKDINPNKKYPLMVFPHGGVHSNFGSGYSHIVKELIGQQYIVVAPDYRGSTGYGRRHYENIDYGGLEVEDTKASRDYMLENYEFVDKNRVGIMGWSHGGLITLMNLFNHPDAYKVGYAGVPVSDLIYRMGYHSQGYLNLYSADYHIGKSVKDDLEEYKKRSPAWNAHKLKTPLLVHTNTNDNDVHSTEVEQLIKALKAEGKKFEYKIYKEMPGGHSFDRLDTKAAKAIRVKVYKFLAKHLKPNKPITSVKDINQAAYR